MSDWKEVLKSLAIKNPEREPRFKKGDSVICLEGGGSNAQQVAGIVESAHSYYEDIYQKVRYRINGFMYCENQVYKNQEEVDNERYARNCESY